MILVYWPASFPWHSTQLQPVAKVQFDCDDVLETFGESLIDVRMSDQDVTGAAKYAK